MTEKRFKPKRHCKDGKCHNFVLDKEQHKFLLMLNSYEDCKDVVDVLNELNSQADAVREELRLCEEENNALQERNDRQAETIRKLYTLIGNKDWKGLTAHMEELDRCEEQLRKEWGVYSD